MVVSTASARLCIRPLQTIETSLLTVVRAPGDRIPRLPPFCRPRPGRSTLPFPLRPLVCCTEAVFQLGRFSVFRSVPTDCERLLNGSSAQNQMSLPSTGAKSAVASCRPSAKQCVAASKIAEQAIDSVRLFNYRHAMAHAAVMFRLPHLNRAAQCREQFRATCYDTQTIFRVTVLVPFDAAGICRPQGPQK